jgi:hypothetical protein
LKVTDDWFFGEANLVPPADIGRPLPEDIGRPLPAERAEFRVLDSWLSNVVDALKLAGDGDQFFDAIKSFLGLKILLLFPDGGRFLRVDISTSAQYSFVTSLLLVKPGSRLCTLHAVY